MRLHERQGATVILMAAANSIAAAFAIQDPIKPEACSVIAALKSLGIMVSAAPLSPDPNLTTLVCFPSVANKTSLPSERSPN